MENIRVGDVFQSKTGHRYVVHEIYPSGAYYLVSESAGFVCSTPEGSQFIPAQPRAGDTVRLKDKPAGEKPFYFRVWEAWEDLKGFYPAVRASAIINGRPGRHKYTLSIEEVRVVSAELIPELQSSSATSTSVDADLAEHAMCAEPAPAPVPEPEPAPPVYGPGLTYEQAVELRPRDKLLYYTVDCDACRWIEVVVVVRIENASPGCSLKIGIEPVNEADRRIIFRRRYINIDRGISYPCVMLCEPAQEPELARAPAQEPEPEPAQEPAAKPCPRRPTTGCQGQLMMGERLIDGQWVARESCLACGYPDLRHAQQPLPRGTRGGSATAVSPITDGDRSQSMDDRRGWGDLIRWDEIAHLPYGEGVTLKERAQREKFWPPLYQPRFCWHCGTDQGCMCPREKP
jgi:hypothetical protein